MTIVLGQRAATRRNQADLRKRLMTIPDVAGFDIRHDRASAGIAGVVEPRCAEERIEIHVSRERARDTRRVWKTGFKVCVGDAQGRLSDLVSRQPTRAA